MNRDFQIKRDNIRESRFVDVEAAPLSAGQVRMRVDKVAFTANNVTYAVAGDFLGYWHFFPTGDNGWGKLPVWGFANVSESANPAIAVGERIYGYFPLGSELIVSADKIHPSGFIDAAPHRQKLNPIYNQYVRTDNVAGFEQEELNALLRPMFMTAFLIDDLLADNDFFDANTLILSSASSKTAYATAFLLNRERDNRIALYSTAALTSDKNIPFVESLGIYSEVFAYDEVKRLEPDYPAVYIDFSGSGRLRRTLHAHLGDQLKYDCAVGLTDWEKRGSSKGLPGVEPQMFFAPAQAQKRVKEWGGGEFQRRVGMAFAAFLDFSAENIEVTPLSDESAMTETYLAMTENKASPRQGYIFLL